MGRWFGGVLKEIHGLINRHVQNVDHRFFTVFYIKDLLFEALSLATFTGKVQIGHKLHFNFHNTFAFTFVAPSTGDVKGKKSGFVITNPGKLLISKQIADFIKGFDVGGRI